MSRSFLTPINLNQNALQNAVLHALSAAPSAPVVGQVYFDTVLLELLQWNGTAWVNKATDSLLLQAQNGAYYLSRANQTGTQLAATISNLQATVIGYTLDTFAAPVAPVSMNGQRVTGVATPTAGTDAANKNYVDISVQGLTAKPSARAATTAALPTNVYANGAAGVGATLTASGVGALTIDTYPVALNDVVLVKNEATAANNGLYNVTTLGTGSVPWVLTRNTDMNSAAAFGGAFIPVENLGTANANSLWICNVANNITVGTTSVVFTQVNGATDLLQGNGISISGNTVSWLPDPGANKGLVVTAAGGAIDKTFAPTWTGAHTFNAVLTAALGLAVTGAPFTSRGITDNATATALTITAGAVVGAPTGGDKGAGTINATGYYLNGAALANGVSANPSASIGIAAVNGTASTFMTSDSAPALNQGITPTWTGQHNFSALLKANLGLTVAGAAFTSRGITDSATATALTISATGGVTLAPASGAALTVTSGATALQALSATTGAFSSNVTITAPTSGQALTVTGFAGSSALQLLATGLQVGAPTGGELGAGKVNVAGGFYVNGVGLNLNSPGKYAQAFGDGSTLAYTITHNLGTQDVVTGVYSATTPFAVVECDVSNATTNTITLTFATAPTANQYRVVVHG